MSDLIRREDAIDAIESICNVPCNKYFINAINKVPNAETTGALDDAIQEYIKDGYILAEPNEYVKDGTLTVQMPTIKEAKAIDKIVVYADTYKQEYLLPIEEPLVTVEAKQNEGLYLNTDEETLLETEYIVVATEGMYKEYIHETDGKPRVGKWIDHSDDGYVECPFCGSLTTCEDNIDELHYCFNCGSRMRGEKDE